MRAVDYFAGAGGFSTGAAIAGLRVVAAANHWPLAVETHQRNHPGVRHICQDLNLFDPGDLPDFDVLLASPSCQGFSRARGKDQPRHDRARATAWAVIDCAELRRPERILVENVPDFAKKWVLFPQWRASLEALGYGVSVNYVNAKEFGVAQDRSRVIVAAARGRKAPVIQSPRLPERGAIEVIDFTSGKWTDTSEYVPATQRRIADGRARGWERFVAPYYSSGSGEIARDIRRPIGTITTLDRWLVVDGDRGRVLSVDECLEFQSFPRGYYLAGNRRERLMQVGNAIPPLLAAEVIRQVCG